MTERSMSRKKLEYKDEGAGRAIVLVSTSEVSLRGKRFHHTFLQDLERKLDVFNIVLARQQAQVEVRNNFCSVIF